MHVAVKHRLACGLIDVDAHVITIGVETLVNFLFYVLQNDIHCFSFMVGKVKVISNVTFGNDQSMSRGHRITVIESNAGGRLADDFHSAGKSAERTLLAFHARQLVEMVVLVEFVAFVADEALVRQFHVTLVRVLLVDGMKPEALFFKVATDGKVGRSLGGKQVGDIHQHLGLGVGFQDVQHIVAEDGVELALGEVRAVVVIVADDVKALLLQLVGIETETASEVENLALEQIVLHEVSGGHREIRALDRCEVGMVYFLWFHSYWGLRVRNPMLTAIWLRGEKVLWQIFRNCSSDICIKSCGEHPKA